jgi:aconitate hydratase
VTRKTLRLRGDEVIDISGAIAPRAELECTIGCADGTHHSLKLRSRLDTRRDVDYFRHGGLLHYVLRQRLSKEEKR